MIIVRILMQDEFGDSEDENQLAEIRIRKTITHDNEIDSADYSIKYAVERGMAVGIHRRNIYGFPRKKYNALALVLQALNTLEPKELELEDDFDPDEAPVSSDMARRLRRALRQIQGG